MLFAFVRVVVVVAPLLLVKEVIVITEREILPKDGPRPKCGNPLNAPPPPVSLERANTNSRVSLSLASSVNDYEYDSLLSLKVFI